MPRIFIQMRCAACDKQATDSRNLSNCEKHIWIVYVCKDCKTLSDDMLQHRCTQKIKP